MLLHTYKILVILCIVVVNTFDVSGQEVKNIVTKIKGKTIILTYDLLAKNPNAICEVTVYFGNNTSQNNKLTYATGDFGSDIQVGLQKRKRILISNLKPFIPYQNNLTFRIEAAFTYNPKVGTISVITEPAGATLYIDKKYAGNTDLQLPYMVIGKYDLKIEKEGYLIIEKEIEVKENETTALIELLAPGYASTIISQPGNSKLQVNGEDMGETPAKVVLKPGKNSINLSAKYYNDFTTTITPDKQNESYEFSLTKKEYKIVISTYPKKTNFSFEGGYHSAGDTLHITGGNKELKISKSKYITSTSSLRIEDTNKLQNFNIILEPEVYRKKGTAMVYSLLLPGMGQHYLKRRGIEPLLGVIGYGLLGLSYKNYNDAVTSYDLYLAETDINSRANLNQQWQKEKKQSSSMLYGAAGIWIGNLIWTLLSKDEAAQYKKIKTEIKFDNVTNTGGISLLYKLGNTKAGR